MNKIPEISKEACIGCGQCTSVCIQKCLVMEEGSPSYTGKGCMGCGHCILICPADAICLKGDTPEDYKSFEKDEFKISPDLLTGFMKTRRSIRFFTDEPVSDEDLAALTEAGRYAPTSQNGRATEFIRILLKVQIPKDTKSFARDQMPMIKTGKTTVFCSGQKQPFLFLPKIT